MAACCKAADGSAFVTDGLHKRESLHLRSERAEEERWGSRRAGFPSDYILLHLASLIDYSFDSS